MTQNVQQSPYLREQRKFPTESLNDLSGQMDHAYIDIASKVNARTIGTFAINVSIVTGESWFLRGQPQKQQTLRRVYTFGVINPGTELNIPTEIKNIEQFTRIYGTVITLNGSSGLPDYRPLPYVDPNVLTTGMTILVGIIGGIQQIRIVLGPTAPQVTSGIAILEWLSVL